MSLAIIDAREWQNMFDLQTGARVEESGALVDLMKDVLNRHPYPGDIDAAGNRWVTEIALDLIGGYRPDFVFLTYARQYFAGRFSPMSETERTAMFAEVFAEVERFADASGFDPIVIGRGGMTPLVGSIDLNRLDGLAISTHWSARYAGLHGPSDADLRYLEKQPGVIRIVERGEFLRLFDGTPEDGQKVPDLLLVAERGYAFSGIGCAMRRPVMIPDAGSHVPLFSRLGEAAELTSIRRVVDNSLRQGRKVALINLEGIGFDEFPWSNTPCENGREWFWYEPGDAQYLAVTTGTHRVFDYPPGYRYFSHDEKKEYPLSGYFESMPGGTIGAEFPGRSIAVGNKSMFMHMVTGADLCVECFARNLYNQGSMGVIHRKDKA
jgi:hypothetical protein